MSSLLWALTSEVDQINFISIALKCHPGERPRAGHRRLAVDGGDRALVGCPTARVDVFSSSTDAAWSLYSKKNEIENKI